MPVTVENPILVMKRVEVKYLISPGQVDFVREKLAGRMEIDRFGLTSIGTLYYDTPDYRLINRSIENPEFKEKIRLRSYGLATADSPVFLEIKRKAYGLVYKRRVRSTIPLVNSFFAGVGDICSEGQINSELKYCRDMYGELVPSCLIIYDRTAYSEPGGDLRLTIDGNPRYRMSELDLTVSMDGTSLLPPGWAVLEIKVQDAMPLWLCSLLSEGKIYKGSFSKYGEAYKKQIIGARAAI